VPAITLRQIILEIISISTYFANKGAIMPRPEKERRVSTKPEALFFKPQGLRLQNLEIIELNFDELEALRLCYRDGHYQHDAAKFMQVSRQTVGRILTNAMVKITKALVEGKALAITGGNVEFSPGKVCPGCWKNLESMSDLCGDCDQFDNLAMRKSI
jgi:predicted DNA-binding protein (UPF0251 family)